MAISAMQSLWQKLCDTLRRMPVWGWVVVLCACAFFVNNAGMPSDIMEVRNLVTAREMAHDGHWMIPTMNGELRLEKPPLPTWASGIVELLSPGNMALHRFTAGLMACLWTWCVFLLARYVSRRQNVALATVLVFITCYQVVFMGRQATWDIWCHALMTAAAYCLLRGLCDEERPRPWRWLPAAGVLMGLSFMSKGPVAFFATLLPWLAAVLIVLRPRWRKELWRPLLVMLLLCVIVSAWWYVYILLVHPEAIQTVAAKETGAWGGRHARPWWYYWCFIYETGIWAPAAVAILAVPYWRKRIEDKKTYMFGIVWLLIALVVLSLVPEKKPRYLLPAMAPFALAVGPWLVHLKAKRLLWGIAILFMIVECFLLPAICRYFAPAYGPSISTVKADSRLHGIQFYHAASEHVKIETVCKAGRTILPINLADSQTVGAALPFAVVTSYPDSGIFSERLLSQADTVMIGRFDDNTHRKSDRHYQETFVTYVVLLTPKIQNE